MSREWEVSHFRVPLQWRYNRCNGVSNHRCLGFLLNRLFRRRSKKTSKLRVTGLCGGIHRWPVNSPHKGPVTRKIFPFDYVTMWQMSFSNHMWADHTLLGVSEPPWSPSWVQRSCCYCCFIIFGLHCWIFCLDSTGPTDLHSVLCLAFNAASIFRRYICGLFYRKYIWKILGGNPTS